MQKDPIDSFIEAVRRNAERFRSNFEADNLTGFSLDAKNDDHGEWIVSGSPKSDDKILRSRQRSARLTGVN